MWVHAADALVLSDAEGIVLAANPAYLYLYGFAANAVIGHSMARIFAPAERAAAIAQNHRVVADSDPVPAYGSVIRRAVGEERVVEARITCVHTDGQRVTMLSTIRDSTARKQAEHAVIQALTVEHILRQAERLTTLIGQLLDVARLQRRLFALDRQPLALTAIVALVVDAVQTAAQRQIVLQRPDGRVWVPGRRPAAGARATTSVRMTRRSGTSLASVAPRTPRWRSRGSAHRWIGGPIAPWTRILVIANPSSGQHAADDTRAQIEARLNAARVASEYRVTTGAGGALRWAKAAPAEGFDLVVAARGDGTIMEAMSGFIASGSEVPLAQLPVGTANLLARAHDPHRFC